MSPIAIRVVACKCCDLGVVAGEELVAPLFHFVKTLDRVFVRFEGSRKRGPDCVDIFLSQDGLKAPVLAL